MPTMHLRPASTADAASICAIYNPCVATTTITFEENAVTEQDMAQRIVDVGRCRFALALSSALLRLVELSGHG